MIDAVEKIISQLPPDVKVIPGHGPISSLDDVRAYLKMLKETRDVVQNAVKQGKTFDQMKQAKILDPWKKYSGDQLAYKVTIFVGTGKSESCVKTSVKTSALGAHGHFYSLPEGTISLSGQTCQTGSPKPEP